MNLLFDFLKYLGEPEREKLKALKLKGVMLQVWQLMHKQVKEGNFDKSKMLAAMDISSSHLDKITSELLAKCYDELFQKDSLKLLHFLGNRAAYLKHFHAELNRCLKYVKENLVVDEQARFYKKCIDLIQVGIPIAYRDEEVLKKLGDKYLALFKGDRKKHAALAVGCKLTLARIDVLFASGDMHKEEASIKKRIDELAPLTKGAEEELVFDFYWMKMFFYHANEKFSEAISVVNEGVSALNKVTSELKEMHIYRFELKSAEFLYYLSRFDESYACYEMLISSPLFAKLPDSGFHVTKYVQICLITGHLNEAKNILDERLSNHRDKIAEWITPRDIFSLIKYYLFAGQFEDAFRFIQLGAEKNPKGKYFQYEVELRNLQIAYFYLTGQEPTALDLCHSSIKYLRNHGYGVKNSGYPHFYILTEAIIKKKTAARLFTTKQEQMLLRYQTGSYAVYGKLLYRMLNS